MWHLLTSQCIGMRRVNCGNRKSSLSCCFFLQGSAQVQSIFRLVVRFLSYEYLLDMFWIFWNKSVRSLASGCLLATLLNDTCKWEKKGFRFRPSRLSRLSSGYWTSKKGRKNVEANFRAELTKRRFYLATANWWAYWLSSLWNWVFYLVGGGLKGWRTRLKKWPQSFPIFCTVKADYLGLHLILLFLVGKVVTPAGLETFLKCSKELSD